MTSVLYDVPGPRAILRNRILGVVTILLVAAAIGFVVYRFAVSGQFSADKWYVFSFGNVWLGIMRALGNTLAAFGLAAIGSLALGFILAIGRLSDHAWVRVPFGVVIEAFRAVPVLIFMMLMYYGLPTLGIRMEPYWAVVIALVAYNGSVLAEALRAGIESLPRGQKEAGYAVGLRKSGVMRLILLPQAVRAMLPVIVAQLVVTLKDTALGFIITYPELLYYAKQLTSQPGRPILQAGIVIGAIYIVMCLLLSWFANFLEKRLSRSPRTTGTAGGGAAAVDPLHHPVAPTTDTELIALQKGIGKHDSTSGAGGV
ncbi:amino acid ABC transporter permease [Microbacterium thalli]|uniref:Amino acid ABC transporter permease n=1 Tax=Microbacterium thalli TaxID=3027921 RepID=A0ABT5SIK5_9MICO|nr:amino acid ABC transporter permease [Microbacterium thalli]MDD7962330.1 amino acid ABC transporter permease [Microbacterium thalli]MDN8548412.1 amino acid ABC transporter permease [Microbacterium thalli]